LRAILATFGKKIHEMLNVTIAKLFEEHMYVFFCNALYIHSNGSFQNGAKQRALVFYCSVHVSFDFAQDHELVEWHLFETPLNGPLFWAFDKKRHTHAPSQALRPGLEFSEAFYESQNGHHERVKGLFTRTLNIIFLINYLHTNGYDNKGFSW